MAVDAGHHDTEEVMDFLRNTGAIEINLIDTDEDH